VAYDPKYKMRYRPAPIGRLCKSSWPMRMIGDPEVENPLRKVRGMTHAQSVWHLRCETIYAYMMTLKSGMIPHEDRRGLWMWS
jgi:hypothetical protein